MIENTSDSMQDPARALLFVATAMGPGGTDGAIQEQERAGQAQLVNSDRLPADLNGDSISSFEALGFTFGHPDPRDPLFHPAALPEDWKREASDHDMWSYIVDHLGRRRVAVFYKAAFYDRRAFMRLNTVDGYVSDCQYNDCDIVTDDTWATPAAVAEAARRHAAGAQKRVDDWTRIAAERGDDHFGASEHIAEFTAERDAYQALAVRFEGQADA